MGINTLVNGTMFMSFATYWLGINTISYEFVQRFYIQLQFLYVIGSTSSRVLIASTQMRAVKRGGTSSTYDTLITAMNSVLQGWHRNVIERWQLLMAIGRGPKGVTSLQDACDHSLAEGEGSHIIPKLGGCTYLQWDKIATKILGKPQVSRKQQERTRAKKRLEKG
eukprot:FR736235.1.p1 GENE.FR736235.1~~FR736235.1.p1  ORF type:complete len:166 (+),score=10.76 FR736235.1:546-1043(+)